MSDLMESYTVRMETYADTSAPTLPAWNTPVKFRAPGANIYSNTSSDRMESYTVRMETYTDTSAPALPAWNTPGGFPGHMPYNLFTQK